MENQYPKGTKAFAFTDFTHSKRSELFSFENGDKAFHEMNDQGVHRIVVIRDKEPIFGQIAIYGHPALWWEPEDCNDQTNAPKYVAFSAYYTGNNETSWVERPFLVSEQ